PDAAESADPAAVRDAREETGPELPGPPARLFKVAACPETGHEFVWVYGCRAEGPFRLHPEESERDGWFAPAALHRWVAERPGELAICFVLIWKEPLRRGLTP